MGIKRKDNKYRIPRKPFDARRIKEEDEIVKKFGLKNKREIWKADFQIKKIKDKAKSLITSSEEEKRDLIEKLNKMGFEIKDIVDALDLSKEDWLERRLQTFVFKKGLAKTIKEARQLVTHKKIIVGDRIVHVPSYFITKDEEDKIKLKEEKKNV